jgi:hypothetical protein
LPCDLQDDTHDAGRLLLGRLQAPLGAGPMFSCGTHISRIFIAIFKPLEQVDHGFIVVFWPDVFLVYMCLKIQAISSLGQYCQLWGVRF